VDAVEFIDGLDQLLNGLGERTGQPLRKEKGHQRQHQQQHGRGHRHQVVGLVQLGAHVVGEIVAEMMGRFQPRKISQGAGGEHQFHFGRRQCFLGDQEIRSAQGGDDVRVRLQVFGQLLVVQAMKQPALFVENIRLVGFVSEDRQQAVERGSTVAVAAGMKMCEGASGHVRVVMQRLIDVGAYGAFHQPRFTMRVIARVLDDEKAGRFEHLGLIKVHDQQRRDGDQQRAEQNA